MLLYPLLLLEQWYVRIIVVGINFVIIVRVGVVIVAVVVHIVIIDLNVFKIRDVCYTGRSVATMVACVVIVVGD